MRRILCFDLIVLSLVACNLLNGTAAGTAPRGATVAPGRVAPAASNPEESATPSIYVPPSCQGQPIATLPAATTVALPTPGLMANPTLSTSQELGELAAVEEIVGSNYLYPDFNGLNWGTATSALASQVKAGMETEAFYSSLKALITSLGDDHSTFKDPADVALDQAELMGFNDYVGIGVHAKSLPDEGVATVLGVLPDSSADHSGIQPHDDLLAVDGLPLVQNSVAYPQRLRGRQCSAMTLTLRSPGAGPRDLTIIRDRILAPIPLNARLIPTADGSRVGYLFIYSLFDTSLQDRVEIALTDFGPLDGLILDFRENGGGEESILRSLLSLFVSGTMGQFTSRGGDRPLQLEAHAVGDSQSVPLVVLVGDGTVSYGEVFSGILQDQGRAKIVGQTTGGNVETLHGYTLADGSELWIAQEKFVPANSHANWEATGFVPDVEAYANWDTFTAGNDPSVIAAVSLFGR